jgi:hypothetical protein
MPRAASDSVVALLNGCRVLARVGHADKQTTRNLYRIARQQPGTDVHVVSIGPRSHPAIGDTRAGERHDQAADAPNCEAALISAAVMSAANRGSGTIKVADVVSGWSERIRPFNLCTPAFHCMQRSIVTRFDDLKTELPMLQDVLNRMK